MLTSAQRSRAARPLAALTALSTLAPSACASTSVERAHARQALVQALHAQVEDLRRLLAPDLRRLAGLGVHPGPARDIASSRAVGPRRPVPACSVAPSPRTRASTALSRARAPGPRRAPGAAGAHRAPPRGQPVRADGRGRQQQPGRSSSPASAAGPRRGSRASAASSSAIDGIAIARASVLQPAQQDLADPGRHPARRPAPPRTVPATHVRQQRDGVVSGERPLRRRAPRRARRRTRTDRCARRRRRRRTARAPCRPACPGWRRSGSASCAGSRPSSIADGALASPSCAVASGSSLGSAASASAARDGRRRHLRRTAGLSLAQLAREPEVHDPHLAVLRRPSRCRA